VVAKQRTERRRRDYRGARESKRHMCVWNGGSLVCSEEDKIGSPQDAYMGENWPRSCPTGEPCVRCLVGSIIDPNLIGI
jgi:hypothetical protein